MKYCISLCLLAFSSIIATAQNDNKIIAGTIDSVYSNILHEQRKIWVYVPDGTDPVYFSKQTYPVVYLLDGDAHFLSIVGMIQQLSTVNGNTVFPKMIVVGIPNTDRTRDLTPTHVDVQPPFVDSAMGKSSGGGEKFISFIEKELMPHIDSVYPTQPYKVFIGHSFGGLTVINTLIHHPDLFNAYIAIDPSMWWDYKKLLGEAKNVLPAHDYKNKVLFMAIANTMSPGMDTARVKKDTSGFSAHIRSILELNQVVRMNEQDHLSYNSKYYNNDDHGSVPLIAAYDGLHFIFSYYKFKVTPDDYFNMDTSLVNKLKNHYEEISQHFGYKVPVPEDVANNWGYQALASKHYDAAEAFFKMNADNYPKSFNVFDSLGDCYDAEGKKDKAIDCYKRALSIKEFPETRKKLEKLQGK